MEKLKKETVWRKKVTYICAVSFFTFIFPYILNLTLHGFSYREQCEVVSEGRKLCIQTPAGMEELPLEEFLIGSLAADIPIEYEDETIKAMSVILRTNAVRACRGDATVQQSDGYLNTVEQYEIWGEKYEENRTRLSSLIAETNRMVMTYKGELITAPFFYVSAGVTREGTQLSTQVEYIQSVNSPLDVLAQEYLQDFTFKTRDLGNEVLIEELDENGYVQRITANSTSYSGDAFRQKFDLPSTNFTIEKRKHTYLIQTKGVGHGFGFSCFGANEMAKKGKEYTELLKYFFYGIEFEKI